MFRKKLVVLILLLQIAGIFGVPGGAYKKKAKGKQKKEYFVKKKNFKNPQILLNQLKNLLQAGDKEKAQTLLKSASNVELNAKDNDGRTPLHLVVEKHYESIVQSLLARKEINVYAQDYYGRTPLHMASANGNIFIVNNYLVKLMLMCKGVINQHLFIMQL